MIEADELVLVMNSNAWDEYYTAEFIYKQMVKNTKNNVFTPYYPDCQLEDYEEVVFAWVVG